jgi:cytochrome P450
MNYDPFAPDTLADPFPAYAWLRRECPVHRTDTRGLHFTTLARHADVLDALKDVGSFSSRYGQGPFRSEPVALFDDPPSHTVFRRLVTTAFTPRAVAQRHDMIAALVRELVDAMLAAPESAADFHDTVAMPLPTIVIARMLGVPEDLRDTFKRWSDAQVAGMGAGDVDEQRRTRREMHDYFLAEIGRRRSLLAAGAPCPDDLVSSLVTAVVDESTARNARAGRADAGADGAAAPAADEPRPISDAELLSLLVQLLVGGNETTTSLVTNLVWRLLERRERWEAVVADPGLVDVAIEESLRHDPPVLGLYRTTTCPVGVAGETIAADEKVMLLWAAANRDAEVWDDPEEFRLDRDLASLRGRHLSFGFGIHACPGAPLSRLEARLVLTELVERVPTLELAAPPTRIEPFFLWGRRTLPVRW